MFGLVIWFTLMRGGPWASTRAPQHADRHVPAPCSRAMFPRHVSSPIARGESRNRGVRISDRAMLRQALDASRRSRRAASLEKRVRARRRADEPFASRARPMAPVHPVRRLLAEPQAKRPAPCALEGHDGRPLTIEEDCSWWIMVELPPRHRQRGKNRDKKGSCRTRWRSRVRRNTTELQSTQTRRNPILARSDTGRPLGRLLRDWKIRKTPERFSARNISRRQSKRICPRGLRLGDCDPNLLSTSAAAMIACA
jgi:hypothetical protein